MSESQPSRIHKDIIPETASEVFGGVKVQTVLPVTRAVEATVASNNVNDWVAELSSRIFQALQGISLIQKAIDDKSCTSSALSRHVNTVDRELGLGLRQHSIERDRIMLALKQRFLEELEVEVTSATTNGRPAPPLLPETIEACEAVVIPQILALDKKTIRFAAIFGPVRTWTNWNKIPRPHTNTIAFAIQERLEHDHGFTVVVSTESKQPAQRAERSNSGIHLSIAAMQVCIDSILPAPYRAYAAMILEKVILKKDIRNGEISYMGIANIMGHILKRNLPSPDLHLHVDALRRVLMDILEFLCATNPQPIVVIGGDTKHTPRPVVTELKPVPAEQIVTKSSFTPDPDDDEQDEIEDDDEESPDDNRPDDGSAEYEDINFEAIGIHPSEPTKAKPGSEEKVLMLAARYAAGMPLWHNDDCTDHGPARDQRIDGDVDPEDRGKFTSPEQREAERQKNITDRLAQKNKKAAAAALRSCASDSAAEIPVDEQESLAALITSQMEDDVSSGVVVDEQSSADDSDDDEEEAPPDDAAILEGD